jgi:hypothetical protein
MGKRDMDIDIWAKRESQGYADGTIKGHGATEAAIRKRLERQREGYGTSPGQLAALPAGTVEGVIDGVVGSPPYAVETDRLCPHGGKSTDGEGGWRNFYSTNPQNLGNPQGAAGLDTFWAAAREIVAQCFAILKPGGVAIWVVKAYCRDGAIVDFPGQWRTLCEHVGFVTVHEHHAMLVERHGMQGELFGAETEQTTQRKSFFRRLHEKKRPDLAINHETVYCMVKPDAGTAPEPGALAVLASPPYAESLNHPQQGIDWTRVAGGTRDRTREPNYAAHHGSGVTAHAYGTQQGQLAAMPPGTPPPEVP